MRSSECRMDRTRAPSKCGVQTAEWRMGSLPSSAEFGAENRSRPAPYHPRYSVTGYVVKLLVSSANSDQFTDFAADVTLLHQGFAHENGLGAGFREAHDAGARVNAAFGNEEWQVAAAR